MDKRMENQSKAEVYKREMVGKRFRHFKGSIYVVTNIGVHSETEKLVVVYESESNRNLVWVRPLDMFLSEVDKKKYPDVKQKMRFEIIREQVKNTEEKKCD